MRLISCFLFTVFVSSINVYSKDLSKVELDRNIDEIDAEIKTIEDEISNLEGSVDKAENLSEDKKDLSLFLKNISHSYAKELFRNNNISFVELLSKDDTPEFTQKISNLWRMVMAFSSAREQKSHESSYAKELSQQIADNIELKKKKIVSLEDTKKKYEEIIAALIKSENEAKRREKESVSNEVTDDKKEPLREGNIDVYEDDNSSLAWPVLSRNIVYESRDKTIFGASHGQEVRAALSGYVFKIEGDKVVLAHPDDFVTEYIGLGGVDVQEGDIVARNQKIGVIKNGASGLVFSVQKEGRYVNAKSFLQKSQP